jgi:hypothetical protein
MAKTRAQWQRPAAKGKHQRSGQRRNTRRYPPAGQEWGSKDWTGTGQGVAQPYGLLLWETQTVVAPSSGAVRVNNADPVMATHVFVSETYQSGSVGDPIATLIVNDPLRIYNANDTTKWIDYKITAITDAGAYRDYTVTQPVNHGGLVPTAGMLMGIAERAATSPFTPYDPGEHTVDEVKEHVNGLPLDDERDNIIQAILDLERANKNRATLVSWLDQQTGVE